MTCEIIDTEEGASGGWDAAAARAVTGAYARGIIS